MYKIYLNSVHKEIAKKALKSVKLSFLDKDLEVFADWADHYQKNLSEEEIEMVAHIKSFIPKLDENVISKIEKLETKIDEEDKLTNEECNLLEKSLDAYSRLGIGQIGLFYENVQNIAGIQWVNSVNSLFVEDQFQSRYLISQTLNIPVGSFLGIAGEKTHNDYKIAYEMKKVICRYLSYERQPEGGFTVNFDRPLAISGEKMCDIYNIETGFKINNGAL